MAQEVILPRQGQSVETCHILGWKKNVGEPVREGEILVEVETDKAAFEIESTASGTLLHIFHGPGEDVPVLAPLALVGEKGEDVASLIENAGKGGEPPAEGGLEEGPAGEQTAAEPAAAGPAGPHPAAARESGAQPVREAPAAAAAKPSGKVAISPRARRLAAREGLSPVQVAGALGGAQGSGPRGRILERDVQAVLKAGGVSAAPAAAPVQPAPGPVVSWAAEFPGPAAEVPVKGIRKVIAERMLDSLRGTAQYTLQASAGAEALLSFRRKLKASPESWGLREITINDLVNFAVSRVLLRHPELNAHFLGEKSLRFERVHLAVAVDTPRGLMVPVVRNASLMSLRQLAAEAARLRAACLENRVTPDELSGGTFTVTNLGALGVEQFTPVLNPPQVAILGVGSIQLKPVEESGEVVFRPSIGLSLTANHQVVDGAPAARFLQELGASVADFELLTAG